MNENYNQYSRPAGEISLVTALANHYSPLINRQINPLTEIAITIGATEGMYGVMQSLLNENDEVILIEPAFDTYPAHVQMSGAITKFISLEYNSLTNNWELDFNKLESIITDKTRILLLNTPHNPTGKVFSLSELEEIAKIVRKYPQIIVLMDEVYEHLVYDNKLHIRLCSLPDMWDRVITVSSCGKTYSITGWKVGWIYGSKTLIEPFILANQWIIYCVSTPTQHALANVLNKSNESYENYSNYYESIAKTYELKRNYLIDLLTEVNLKPLTIPDGGYFIMADTSNYKVPEKYYYNDYETNDSTNNDSDSSVSEKFDFTKKNTSRIKVSRDWAFARYLTVEYGVTCIPPSVFYTSSQENKDKVQNMARFAFCKTDDLLVEARKRLLKLVK